MKKTEWQIRVKNKGSHLYGLKAGLRKHLAIRGYANEISIFTLEQEHNFKIIDGQKKPKYEITISQKEHKYHNVEINIRVHEEEIKQYYEIVFLIEDYFKIFTNFYFYVETLSKNQIEFVFGNNRDLNPKQIYDRLKQNPVNMKTKSPERIHQYGEYDNTVFYHGTKEEYQDIINFWLSFKTWIFMDDVNEYNDINSFANLNYINQGIGKCIPIHKDSDSAKKIISFIETIDSIDSQSLKYNAAYEMGFEWDNRIILFDFGDQFIIYNWWTSQ